MEDSDVTTRMAALAAPSRLDIVKLLAKPYAREGMKSGEIASTLRVPQNTLSTQLLTLSNARLVRSERRGRNIIYRLNRDALQDLISFMERDCDARGSAS